MACHAVHAAALLLIEASYNVAAAVLGGACCFTGASACVLDRITLLPRLVDWEGERARMGREGEGGGVGEGVCGVCAWGAGMSLWTCWVLGAGQPQSVCRQCKQLATAPPTCRQGAGEAVLGLALAPPALLPYHHP